MKTYLENYKHFGNCLYIENGDVKLAVPLSFGIRIVYLSYKGSENLFFEQPSEMKDLSTDWGWRVFGGHRLWIAPESKDNYAVETNPISYEIVDDKVILTQPFDSWLKVYKKIEISFEKDNVVKLLHVITNGDDKVRKFSPWAVSSMAGGGTEFIPLFYRDGGYDPLHRISMWDYTSLGDERVEYTRELITLRHKPTSKKYKIGVGHPNGNVKYVNKGVVFEKEYELSNSEYPDGNVSFETFMCDYMVEVESLAPLTEVKPNESAYHIEKWILNKDN